MLSLQIRLCCIFIVPHFKNAYVEKCVDYQGLYDFSLNNVLYKMSDSVILNVYFNNNYRFIEQL